ncbi:MAG: MerR family transcriptional regulator [Myxococcota bacterium]
MVERSPSPHIPVRADTVSEVHAAPLVPASEPTLEPAPLESLELLRIGDLARLTQKTVRALHFYEELEILRPAERTRGGFRLYAQESVTRVWLIDKLQTLGLSLPEIRDLLRGWEESETGSLAARKLLEVMLERRQQLQAEVARLQGLARELDATVEYLHHCVTGCFKATSPGQCTRCDHAADDARPRMIAGLYPH